MNRPTVQARLHAAIVAEAFCRAIAAAEPEARISGGASKCRLARRSRNRNSAAVLIC